MHESWYMKLVRALLVSQILMSLLLISTFSGLAYSDDTKPEECGGVLMTSRTRGLDGHQALVEKLGFYMIDGGLVMNGKSTCTSIHIECAKAAQTCRIATAVTDLLLGHPHVGGIFMSDDYKITEWTKDSISAEMRPMGGGTSQLHIGINDNVPDNVDLINVTKSFVAKPGEWVTEVMTVASDPLLTKLLSDQKGN
jgi:hypothetical protein